jgi:hypothetical protein
MYEGQWECPDCGPTMPEPNKTSKEEIEYAVTVEKNMNDQYQKWVDDMSRALGVECPVLPKGAKPLDLEDWFKKPGGGK